MNPQTRTEFLIDALATRHGIPKPTADQEAAFAPADARADLLAILADPQAAKARLDAITAADVKHQRMIDAAKKAQAELAQTNKAIADAQATHEQRIADEIASHTMALDRRTRDAELREKAVADREHDLANAQAKLAADRAALDKTRDAIRKAAA